MMRSKIHAIILFAFLSKLSVAQYLPPDEKDELRKAVYSALMDDFCKEKTWAYVMDDSTRNHYIFQWPPQRYIEHFDNTWMAKPPPFPLDSIWIPFLKKVDTALGTVKRVRVPEFTSIAKIYLLNRDTIRARSTHSDNLFEGMGWMQAKISVSDVVFSDSGNMAIVEFSQVCGSLCGSGALVLLQRDENKLWRVVHKIGLWVS
jgi:hypothetical protein